MVDALTTTYALHCPHAGRSRVRLSAFRRLERLAGAAHPAVYRVVFACGCGEEHHGLVAHDELDWGLLGLGTEATFVNVLTDRHDGVAAELRALVVQRLARGEWPWTFFCHLEGRTRPVTPSAFVALAPGGDRVGIAVRCPACEATSVNLVSDLHVDLPFWHDAHVGVVDHVFEPDAVRTVDAFRAELASARFDVRRLELEL